MRDTAKMSRRDFMFGAGAAAAAAASGCAPGYNPDSDAPFNYAAELDMKCDNYLKDGKLLEYIGARFRWAFAVVNGFTEVPFEATLKTFGGLLGGNEGTENAEKFSSYLFKNLPGGRINDKVQDLLFRGDVKEAIETIYKNADSELEGHIGLVLVGGTNYLFFDAAQKALFGGECMFDKLFGTNITDVGDGAAAVSKHKPDPYPGI